MLCRVNCVIVIAETEFAKIQTAALRFLQYSHILKSIAILRIISGMESVPLTAVLVVRISAYYDEC